MATTHVPDIAPVQLENSTAANSVPVAASLSPQEVERICKAFIRLLVAEESTPTQDSTITKRKARRSEA